MAMGGGTFVTQNKKLPGAYINLVSAKRATANVGDRGVCAVPMELDWGRTDGMITVTEEQVQKDSLKLFGYSYTDDEMLPVRELFTGGTVKANIYRINAGTGAAKAAGTYGTAKWEGIKGNDITISVSTNIDIPSAFDVVTYFGTTKVDSQTVAKSEELVDNEYVTYKKDAELSVTAGDKFTGGANATELTGEDYSRFLKAAEHCSFNITGTNSMDEKVKALFAAFVKRMIEKVGVKIQCVLFDYTKADHEGVISVKNCADAVWWTIGAECSCAINKSLTNRIYDGEVEIPTQEDQSELEDAIDNGYFVFHMEDDDIRVLDDINTLKTFTEEKGEDFKSNQTIRVIFQIANDIASMFNNRYVGKVQNNKDGRISLWGDIRKHHLELQKLGAIENFSDADLKVEQGESKKSVVVQDVVTVVVAMEQLYMTVVVA